MFGELCKKVSEGGQTERIHEQAMGSFNLIHPVGGAVFSWPEPPRYYQFDSPGSSCVLLAAAFVLRCLDMSRIDANRKLRKAYFLSKLGRTCAGLCGLFWIALVGRATKRTVAQHVTPHDRHMIGA